MRPPPVAEKGSRASGSGQQATSLITGEVAAGHRNRTLRTYKDGKLLAEQGILTYCATLLLRCPVLSLPQAAASITDRCHSLRSLHLPPAALSSLPPLEYLYTLRGRVACLGGFIDLCLGVAKTANRLKSPAPTAL